MENKLKRPISVNDSGMIQDDLIHDSEIIGFKNHKNGIIEVDLISVTNVKLQLLLQGVTHLLCNSFMLQNIILDVFLIEGDEAKKNIQENSKLFYISDAQLFLLKSKIDKKEILFFQIAPSIGFEVFAICKSVELFEVS